MSEATKRYHVYREIQRGNFNLPKEHEQIVKIDRCRGNYLYDVITEDGTSMVAVMPAKFRKLLWVKVNGFVVVEELNSDKVQFEIVNIVTADYLKFLKKSDAFPSAFEDKESEKECDGDKNKKDDGSDSESSDDDADLFVNTNRRQVYDESSEEDESESD